MSIRTKEGGIPRCYTREGDSTNGPDQNQRNRGLEDATKPQRCPRILRLHRILQILRPKLLKDRLPTDRTHEESSTVPLGRSTTQSIRNTQIANVQSPCTQTTRLYQTILSINQRLSLRHGSRTLTRGRNKPSHQKTNTTTHRLLLRHVHPHRKKLRHLRTRITSCHQSPNTLATPPRGHERPSNHTHGPCEPHLLEDTTNHQPKSRQMVYRTSRLQPRHKTRTWKDTRSCGYAIQTTRSRQRRRRQHRRHTPPRTYICKISR